MSKSTTVVVKSFAALLATGLGTLGGFNYVSGGNVWGTGNDYPNLPSPTSISAVAGSYVTAQPNTQPTTEQSTEPTTETESAEIGSTEQSEPEADGSCCTPTGRAGFLTDTKTPAPTDLPIVAADDEG